MFVTFDHLILYVVYLYCIVKSINKLRIFQKQCPCRSQTLVWPLFIETTYHRSNRSCENCSLCVPWIIQSHMDTVFYMPFFNKTRHVKMNPELLLGWEQGLPGVFAGCLATIQLWQDTTFTLWLLLGLTITNILALEVLLGSKKVIKQNVELLL